MIPRPRLLALPLIGLALAGCRTGINYASPEGPRYGGTSAAALPVVSPGPEAVRIVSFNIQFAWHMDRAIALFDSVPALRGADVIMLQEMDAPGTERIARALGMSWVYYPATVHPHTHRDFGDAILSRWPIVADQKIILPHLARFEHIEREAVAATILVAGTRLRVYSTHLGTIVDEGFGSRRDQMRAILADARRFPRVVIGGDLNSHGVGSLALGEGYAWPTEHGPHTTPLGRFDHIFFKGFAAAREPTSGTVLNNGGASDHRPVWAVAVLNPVPRAQVVASSP